jgi:protein gp37
MNNTPIEWTDFTINPFRFRNLETGKVGHYCEKISPGCANCYSGEMQRGPYLSGLTFIKENRAKGEIFFEPKVLDDVLKRKKPCRLFWCDMTDMFLVDYPDWQIDLCTNVMSKTPHILHQVLTKRTGRMAGYFLDRMAMGAPVLKNVILGASVENQTYADIRCVDMQRLAARGWRTFVSYEPALGPVDWIGWDFLEQGIVGGESGPGARPFDLEWARSAVKQWRAAGTAPFVKQLGSNPYAMVQPEGYDAPYRVEPQFDHKKGGDMSEWPEDLQFVREGPFATPTKVTT